MKKATLLLIAVLFGAFGALTAQSINFEIRNEQLVGGNYEFDVYMAADQMGTFHSRGQLYISYNPAVFGVNPEANGRVTWTHLDLLNEAPVFSPTTPKYTTINVVDNGNNIAFTWQGNFLTLPPSGFFHTEVADSMRALYHISMQIVTSGSEDIDLNRSLMAGQQFFLVSGGVEQAYADGFLPVEFLDFTADKLSLNQVDLAWITAREQNNDRFVIEKKRDLGEFEPIGEVKGAGTTDDLTTYGFVDETPMGSVNAYRLRQIDFDGTQSFSEVIEIHFDAGDNNEFTVYPSPAYEFTNIQANYKLDQDYRVYVSDMSGRVLSTTTLQKDAPNSEIRLDLADYSEGLYFVKLVSPLGKTYTNRFLKLNR